MDLDQPGTTTKPVNRVFVVSAPGLSRDLLSTRKAAEQLGKPLVFYETKTVLEFPGGVSLGFNFCSRKGLFSAICSRRTLSQGAALGLAAKTGETTRVEVTDQRRPCADVR